MSAWPTAEDVARLRHGQADVLDTLATEMAEEGSRRTAAVLRDVARTLRECPPAAGPVRSEPAPGDEALTADERALFVKAVNAGIRSDDLTEDDAAVCFEALDRLARWSGQTPEGGT